MDMARIVRTTSAILTAFLLVVPLGHATANDHARFVEPKLYIAKGGAVAPQVALTLDACSGQTDMRILNTLVENHIPSTIFVTGRWLKRNAEALAVLKAHPDLFEPYSGDRQPADNVRVENRRLASRDPRRD
jgi:peptidoglycan/xylan/chitin deacetylase (PgdA/CDA1 family)